MDLAGLMWKKKGFQTGVIVGPYMCKVCERMNWLRRHSSDKHFWDYKELPDLLSQGLRLFLSFQEDNSLSYDR